MVNESGSRSSEQSRQRRLGVVGTHSNNGARYVPNRLLKRLKCRNEIRHDIDRFQPPLNQIPSSEIASRLSSLGRWRFSVAFAGWVPVAAFQRGVVPQH